jgi:hypothetical protein
VISGIFAGVDFLFGCTAIYHGEWNAGLFSVIPLVVGGALLVYAESQEGQSATVELTPDHLVFTQIGAGELRKGRRCLGIRLWGEDWFSAGWIGATAGADPHDQGWGKSGHS